MSTRKRGQDNCLLHSPCLRTLSHLCIPTQTHTHRDILACLKPPWHSLVAYRSCYFVVLCFFFSLRLQGGRKKEKRSKYSSVLFLLDPRDQGTKHRQTHRNDTRSDFLDANASPSLPPSIVKRKERKKRKKEEKKSCVNVVILSRRGSSSIFVDRTHNNLAQATNNRKRKEKENGSPSI